MTLDLEPTTSPSAQLDLEPVSGSVQNLDLEPITEAQPESLTPASDKALKETPAFSFLPKSGTQTDQLEGREVLNDPAIRKPLKSVAKTAVGMVTTGLPEFGRMVADPWSPQTLHSLLGQGLGTAVQIKQVETSPPFSQAWWDAAVPLTAQILGTAAGVRESFVPLERPPIQEMIPNAKSISETAPIHGLQPEPQMPQETISPSTDEGSQGISARGQGEIVGGAPQETDVVEPVGLTETLSELKRRNIVTPGEVALPETAPTLTNTPESADAGVVPLGGVHAEAMAERPIIAPEPGDAVGWEEATKRGNEWLDAGGDPQKIIRSFRSTGKIGVPDMGRMRAAMLRIEAVTNQAGDALRVAPERPELQKAYQDSVAREQAFAEAYKPMHTVASNTLRSLQGRVPLTEDMAQSFTALERQFRDINGDKPFSPEHVKRANRISNEMAKANREYVKANGELYNRLDSEYGRIRSARKGPPTLDDLARTFGEGLKEVCDT